MEPVFVHYKFQHRMGHPHSLHSQSATTLRNKPHGGGAGAQGRHCRGVLDAARSTPGRDAGLAPDAARRRRGAGQPRSHAAVEEQPGPATQGAAGAMGGAAEDFETTVREATVEVPDAARAVVVSLDGVMAPMRGGYREAGCATVSLVDADGESERRCSGHGCLRAPDLDANCNCAQGRRPVESTTAMRTRRRTLRPRAFDRSFTWRIPGVCALLAARGLRASGDCLPRRAFSFPATADPGARFRFPRRHRPGQLHPPRLLSRLAAIRCRERGA